MKKPRILLLDLETVPHVGTFWQLKVDGYLSPQNILREAYILCAAWKWLGKKKIHAAKSRVRTDLADNAAFPDMPVLKALHQAFSQADAIVAQNGDDFDIPWVWSRVLLAGLGPLPPVIQIDTLKILRKHFNFPSNKLDYVAQRLGCGKKLKTDFDLWLNVMKGDPAAYAKMIRYNKHDVRLLEKVYRKLAPFTPARLNAALFSDDEERTCPSPTCGKRTLVRRGTAYTTTRPWRRYQCSTCGHWCKKPMRSKLAGKKIPR